MTYEKSKREEMLEFLLLFGVTDYVVFVYQEILGFVSRLITDNRE